MQIDVKTPSRPPGFAFVEFQNARDAEDACRARDGYDFAGGRIRVSFRVQGTFRVARNVCLCGEGICNY